jgi:hypothetical protein
MTAGDSILMMMVPGSVVVTETLSPMVNPNCFNQAPVRISRGWSVGAADTVNDLASFFIVKLLKMSMFVAVGGLKSFIGRRKGDGLKNQRDVNISKKHIIMS